MGVLLALAFALPAFAAYAEAPVVVDPADQVNAAISGQVVVWQDFRNKSFGCPNAQNCISADIYARNLGTGVEQRLSLTSNAMDPDIDGNLVVWRDWSTGKIIVHDLAAGTQLNASTLGGTIQMVKPAVSGQIVVWADYRNSNEYGDIYMRDLTQPADVAVSVAPSDPAISVSQKDKRNPDIDGNIIVWEDWTNAYQDQWGWWHNPDIFMKDLSTGVIQSVTTNKSDQYSPTVSGDKVFWQDYRNGNWDIYMKDLSTGVESRVTNDNAYQSWPAADGDVLTWKDTRNGNEDIYMQRISTGVERPVSVDAAAQKIPVVSGATIAWIDKRNSNWDVYTAQLDFTAPQVDTVTPSGWLNSGSATIGATYSDVGEGVDPASVAVKVNGGPLTGCSAGVAGVSCPVTEVPDGNYDITVELSDLAGNAATATAAFSVDTRGPVIGTPVIDSQSDSDTATITASLSDPVPASGLDAASVSVKVNGGTLSNCTVTAGQVSCTVSGLAIGVQQLQVNAADVLGNSSSLTDSFEITDTVAPQISNAIPSGKTTTPDPDISASFDDPYPGSGVDSGTAAVKIDGNALSVCTATATGVSCHATGLADGDHQVSVSVDDASGNTATHNWSFSINTGGPVIDNLVPANGAAVNDPWTAISADISDSSPGVDPASIRVYLDSVDITASTVFSNGSLHYKLSQGTDPGFDVGQPHTARIEAADLDGEPEVQEWSFTVTAPQLKLFHLQTYWPSYAAYTQGVLMVDYRMSNPGTGACRTAQVATGTATGGVIVAGPLPVALGDIPAGLYSDFNISYMVPAGVKSFLAVSNADCLDDGGNSYWFAGPPLT